MSDTKPWSDDEYPWINGEMNSPTQIGMAARIVSRWGKDWHRMGRDEATYNSALNDIMDLADTITKVLAQLAAERDASRITDATLTGDLEMARNQIAELEAERNRWRDNCTSGSRNATETWQDWDRRYKALESQLATAQQWRTRWKAMAKRKRQHHRNALAALGLNITYVRELQQEVKRLDEQVDALRAQLATLQAATPVGLDAPDSAGWWAFEGKSDDDEMEYKTVHLVLKTRVGLMASRDNEFKLVSYWHGKWHRLHMPWDATPVADAEGVVWEDVEYNDIVSDAQRSFELRVVIDQSEKQNKAVHIHIRKRVLGELAHVGIATLADGYRLQKRRPHAQQDSQEGVQGGQPAIDARMDS